MVNIMSITSEKMLKEANDLREDIEHLIDKTDCIENWNLKELPINWDMRYLTNLLDEDAICAINNYVRKKLKKHLRESKNRLNVLLK